MERYKKKDMLQSISTLIRVNDSVLNLITTNVDSASQALVQCQETAILIGTYIEGLGNEYVDVVRGLEDYCESIYLMSTSLDDGKLCRKLSKKVQKQLMQIKNSIQYELPEDRKEVVFLPYVASMWDSLESIWLAADQDENVDAYVIPIPYYDKNPDGTFREEHYEGDLYPDYVNITRYNEYNFEERRPDVIFIHAPYDECNHVTSVHPYFYAKNIRNYTDMLVYIPYFILEEIEVDNQHAIDNMKHFCFLPGTIYANKVVVQSEKMRKIYINEYIKAAKEMGLSGNHIDRRFLEQRILGIGSPKVDKVLTTKKENISIPEEWMKRIRKPDGRFKKIVFYNTGINALLRNDERLLIKIESVFEIFKEIKDDFTLLWRPHPLIENTLVSMRPDIQERYKIIKDNYISEAWGIYDNTPDMDRAVALSDVYYGDQSSVVHLYEKTGKPILIQSPEINRQSKNFMPHSANWWVDGHKIWFIGMRYNILFCVDMQTHICEFEAQIPYGESRRYNLNPMCLSVGDDVFCMPYLGHCIQIYQKKTKDFLKLEIDSPDAGVPISISWSYLYDNRIFAVSYGLRKIIEINPVSKEITGYYPLEIGEKFLCVEMKENIIYSLIGEMNKIVCFDVITQETYVYNVPGIIKNVCAFYVDNEKIWLSGNHKEVYIWNRKDNTVNVLNNFPKGFGIYTEAKSGQGILDCESCVYDVQVFANLIGLGEYIWCIPYLTNKILYINKNSFEIKALDIEDEIETSESIQSRKFIEGRYYVRYVRESRYLGILSTKNQHIIEIDTKELRVVTYGCSYSKACRRDLKRAIVQNNGVMCENAVINIDNFLQDIYEEYSENIAENSQNIGQNIFREIIS